MEAEAYAKAIRAALAYTGQTQEDLAKRLHIHKDTLGRKLRQPRSLTLGDIEDADKAIHFTYFLRGEGS